MNNNVSRPGSSASLAEWLVWLESLSSSEIVLGLERVSAVMARMNLRRPLRTITVAGTNGKGSSVAMLESLYLQRDRSVGAYTSPHIHRYNERVRVAGEDVADGDIVECLARVEAARDGVPLTYFEFGTLAALDHFSQREVDTVILEIGLGGRLDAVNAVDPDGGIITNIALDHSDWLGDDIESIAAEKAGIMRAAKPFVFGADPVPDAVSSRAAELGADLRIADRDFRYARGASGWTFTGRDCEIADLAPLSLRAGIQYQNAAAVLALVEALGDSDLLVRETLSAAFANIRLNGRCQVLQKQHHWIIDVAHNPAAATAIAHSLPDLLKENPDGGELCCIIGVLSDKDAAGIIQALMPLVGRWIAVTPDGSRAVDAHELARQIANLADRPCRIVPSIADACALAGAEGSGSVLVTGSFMTVGPALTWIGRHAP